MLLVRGPLESFAVGAKDAGRPPDHILAALRARLNRDTRLFLAEKIHNGYQRWAMVASHQCPAQDDGAAGADHLLGVLVVVSNAL